jgi:hypothetical protein
MAYNSLFTTVITTTQAPLKCQPGWTEVSDGGRCYRAYKDKPLTWFEAEAFCAKLAPGGHLASFSSQASQSQTTNGQSIYSGTYWIGLNKLDGKDGGYKWIDGRAAAFFSWDLGQPSDFNGVEDCVEMNSYGKWWDRVCYTNKLYICAIDRGLVPANVTNVDVHNQSFPSMFIFHIKLTYISVTF